MDIIILTRSNFQGMGGDQACNLSIWEVEAGGSGGQGYPKPYRVNLNPFLGT